ncbi:hypothetical protein NDU88_005294 [Pleurodeles waltl]|uniref:Uncharacterized protein n=1 Tax=Pleurodeles waltl TaxID=8319 RepID=A0AAV7TC70_PLEWA|nr:hypothetical protein NDU88_005294 [Pleurodeles waltl]
MSRSRPQKFKTFQSVQPVVVMDDDDLDDDGNGDGGSPIRMWMTSSPVGAPGPVDALTKYFDHCDEGGWLVSSFLPVALLLRAGGALWGFSVSWPPLTAWDVFGSAWRLLPAQRVEFFRFGLLPEGFS